MLKLAACIAFVGAFAMSTSSLAQALSEHQPDPIKLSLAHELYEAQGGQAALNTRFKSTFDIINAQIIKSLPVEQRHFATVLQMNIQHQTVLAMGSMMENLLDIYARELTETELRDDIAWLRSDSGRSINKKMPEIQRQLMIQMLPDLMKMGPLVTKAALEQTCEQEHCTAQDHDVIADVIAKAVPHSGT